MKKGNALRFHQINWGCADFLQEWLLEIGGVVNLHVQLAYLLDARPLCARPSTAGLNCDCATVQLLLLRGRLMDTC